MSDREKVNNDLQRQIEEMEERLAIVLEGQPEIVLCNDCIHWDRHTEECGNPDSVCFRNGLCKPDWYCAGGKCK